MKYILFEKSAVETLAQQSEYQSVEFPYGKKFIDIIQEQTSDLELKDLYVGKDMKKGLVFSGKNHELSFLLFDLEQCKLLEKENNIESLMLVFQKVFRTSIRIWNRHPFTSSERVNGTKSIIFPFAYTDRRRIVIERAPVCERLKTRGIVRPLLVYKYGVEDEPSGGEVAKEDVLKNAGEEYLNMRAEIINYFESKMINRVNGDNRESLIISSSKEHVSDEDFTCMSYEQQLTRLTMTQRKVVDNPNISAPIRIDGAAGTGKTVSMILRAYRLLEENRKCNQAYKIIFISHNETTKNQVEYAFSLLKNAQIYINVESKQSIEFTTLLRYCIKLINLGESKILDLDANDAKQTQRMLIEDALDKMMQERYKSYKALVSQPFKDIFNEEKTTKGILVSMLQHEFSIQIKGRTNGTIEEYYNLEPIENGLPSKEKREKEFVFSIFQEYENMLKMTSSYDSDDIVIEAIAQLNAPIWRRERNEKGFDYIFVDEMHLFNINEQHVFHYLTKSISQKEIPICFALDYGQAIGDRGDIKKDYIEKTFEGGQNNVYNTVFRSSQQITDFCASISAAGALMFQENYKNPYNNPISGFTHQEELLCETPKVFMYKNDEEMISSLKVHLDEIKKKLQCKNHEIAVVAFDESMMEDEFIRKIEQLTNKKIFSIRHKYSGGLDQKMKASDPLIMISPNNVNGLEFKCVILLGVDDGRVPQNIGVSDVSANYIKYIAFNQLYLTSSRAKYRLLVLGNALHGVSPCLKYALENGTLLNDTAKSE